MSTLLTRTRGVSPRVPVLARTSGRRGTSSSINVDKPHAKPGGLVRGIGIFSFAGGRGCILIRSRDGGGGGGGGGGKFALLAGILLHSPPPSHSI